MARKLHVPRSIACTRDASCLCAGCPPCAKHVSLHSGGLVAQNLHLLFQRMGRVALRRSQRMWNEYWSMVQASRDTDLHVAQSCSSQEQAERSATCFRIVGCHIVDHRCDAFTIHSPFDQSDLHVQSRRHPISTTARIMCASVPKMGRQKTETSGVVITSSRFTHTYPVLIHPHSQLPVHLSVLLSSSPYPLRPQTTG